MYKRMITNDIRKSKLITITTLAFVTAAAMLVSLAAILIVNLAGSIDAMMVQAKTPHFMQMHSGDLDMASLTAFADGQKKIEEWQVLEYLNIENSAIMLDDESLTNNVQDNGLSVQSGQFDYLLDLDGQVIEPKAGEVYVPLAYLKEGIAEIGGTLTIYGYPLTIAGFLRDSQMNSTLSSSKRFLVNEQDYNALKDLGSVEFLIEYRLSDTKYISDFEAAYLSAGLPANGPAITYPLFRMINALSDGLMIGIILLVSLLVIAVAFLCIRFTLLAKIEEDYREIGVMKAIGLRLSDIKRLYMAKYSAIVALGCLLGFVLSFAFRGVLLENIRLYMGESGSDTLAFVLGLVGVLLVFIVITAYVSLILRRFRKISAASALRFGISQENKSGSNQFKLSGKSFLPVNFFLAVKDVLARKKQYITLLVVLVLATFILVLPLNIYNTISSDGFIRYMGIGQTDMLMNIQQIENMPVAIDNVIYALEQDADVSQYVALTTKAFTTTTADGVENRLRVELGDHSVFPVEYTSGKFPETDSEIALSVMQAEELEISVGDTIKIRSSSGEKTLTVCGIYSDITNGGKTVKASFTDNSADMMWCTISASFNDIASTDEKIQEYTQTFEFAKVAGIETYMEQVFGPTIRAVGTASRAAAVVALGITILIVLLFVRMLLAKDRHDVAILKAFGFTNKDIRIQYVTRCLLVLVIGVVLGMLLVNTLGSGLAGILISLLGVSFFRFEVNLLVAYLLCPLSIAMVTLLASLLGTTRAGQVQISENIKE